MTDMFSNPDIQQRPNSEVLNKLNSEFALNVHKIPCEKLNQDIPYEDEDLNERKDPLKWSTSQSEHSNTYAEMPSIRNHMNSINYKRPVT